MAKKLTINSVALGNLRQRRKQYRALIAAIVLAMIFSSGVPFFASCAEASKLETMRRATGKQTALVFDTQDLDLMPLQESGLLSEPIGYIHLLSFDWTENREKGMTVGWLDETAAEQYYLQLWDGRMPEARGEIAIERTQLLRLGLEDTPIGGTITLREVPTDGNGYLETVSEKQYTLCGILENRKSVIEGDEGRTEGYVAKIPAAFVSKEEPLALGGRESHIALLSFSDTDVQMTELLWEVGAGEQMIYTYYMNHWGAQLNSIQSTSVLATSLSVLLAALSCFGIANAFASNLRERRQQIGLLRAVGATRRQIIQLFGREAMLIGLISAPLSVCLSYFGVKLFAKLMGDSFVFVPNFSLLVGGGVFGFAAVMVSALLPLLRACRVPPMQAIRDVELARKMHTRRIRSQKDFQMGKLLAKRKLMFMGLRQIALSLLLTFATVILFAVIGQSTQWLRNLDAIRNPYDYEVSASIWDVVHSAFLYEPENERIITQAQRQEILALPYVKEVSGQKNAWINLQIDGEFPPYLEVNEYGTEAYGNSRFESVGNSVYRVGSAPTRENLRQLVQQYPNPDYEERHSWGGYTEEIYAAPFLAQSPQWIAGLAPFVWEGEIDLDKLNSGEEILLNAPEKVGFHLRQYPNGGWSMGLMDLSAEAEPFYSKDDQKNMEHLLAEAECPYHAGDLLRLSMLTMGPEGEPIRQDRTVRIGAILSDPQKLGMGYVHYGNSNEFAVLTTTEGFDQFHRFSGYDTVKIRLNTQVTPEIDQEMTAILEALCPGTYIRSDFASNERAKEDFKIQTAVLGSLVLVLCAVAISLVNGSISAQIREGKRTIGTLRAVGASKRDVMKSYQRQLLPMTGLGVLLGMCIYLGACGYLYLHYGAQVLRQEIGAFVLWPAPVLFGGIYGICRLHLSNQLRKVSRQSIVENIREL